MLGPRLWRSKLYWLAICCSFFGIFVYFSVLSFDTYIIKKPIQTDLNYHNHEEIQMPELMFCPVSPNQTAFENFFPGTFGPMFAFLSSFSEHPIFSGIRDAIRKNISAAFEKYPHLEKDWNKLYTNANLDPVTAAFFGQYKFRAPT